ncbi:MAG: alpha/beta hydrolase [Solirubrobacteraceae bacterium]
MSDPILLIHGLWMTPLSWEHWVERFTAKGHEVHAPAWPGFDTGVEALNRDPSPARGVGIAQILGHYERFIRGLDRPPIIMGHSFGGLFTTILVDRGLGVAGVSVDGAQPKGVFTLPLSTLRATRPVLANPFNSGKATALTHEQFHYAFTNTLSDADSRAAYERYAVPAANRVLFEGALANVMPSAPTKVDFANASRAPLLLLAGGKDNVIPPSLTNAIAKKYAKSPATTEVKLWPERSHFTVGQPGWEEVADHALDWAVAHAKR